jgi:hypothetical protein
MSIGVRRGYKRQPPAAIDLLIEQAWYPRWIKPFEVVGAIMVTLGVSGELFTEFTHARLESSLRNLDNSIVSSMGRQAAAADERAALAELRRVELQARIVDVFGPRRLTIDQPTRIAGKLSDLNGVKVDVYVFGLGNPWNPTERKESIDLTRSIAKSLRMAHIKADAWMLGFLGRV